MFVQAVDDRADGQGRIVMIGMKPQWRGQPFGTFKMLFNATLYTASVAAQTPVNDDFWTAPEEEEIEGAGNGREGRDP